MSKSGFGETAITLKDDPDGETIHRLLKSLSATPGVVETDYIYLTKKLCVKYDLNVLTHPQVIQHIERILSERQVPGPSSR